MAEDRGFFDKLAEAFREVTGGAMTDIRQTWERAWFGRETALEDAAGGMAKQLGWVKEEVGTLNTNLASIRDQLAKGRDPAAGVNERLAGEWTPEPAPADRERGMDR